MRDFTGGFAGWVEASIHDIVKREPGIVCAFQFVLIASIDSQPDLRQIAAAKAITEKNEDCFFLGGSLVVPGRMVPELAKEPSLFTGFDELWCFDEIKHLGRPPDLTIVSPCNVEESIPAGLGGWFQLSHCVLGLGDGIGMNYVSTDALVCCQIEALAYRLRKER